MRGKKKSGEQGGDERTKGEMGKSQTKDKWDDRKTWQAVKTDESRKEPRMEGTENKETSMDSDRKIINVDQTYKMRKVRLHVGYKRTISF